MKSNLEKQEVIEKLLMMIVLSPAQNKPGELIKKLTDTEREVLKECTAEDFNHRLDGII